MQGVDAASNHPTPELAQSTAQAAGRGSDPVPQGRGGRSTAPRGEWWNDAEVQKELALTPDKIKRIDDLYSVRTRNLKPLVAEFVRQSAELEKMTEAAVTDESIYSLQVLRVEAMRSRLNESRTMMLYRIYRELAPDQYKKLLQIFERRAAHRARGGDAPR